MSTSAGPATPSQLDTDIRFLLANERTLLAWVRTALTLQAGGFALRHINSNSVAGRWSGIVAILCGGLVAIIGYVRFRAADRAIRSHTLPKTGRGPASEVIIVVLIAIVLAAIEIIGLR